ncbi:hypothetical protein [Sporosarcina cyprini]|uniref:hypothetical protein n=1 Tax=Sporosarcina cyprini TaxID=2910523 RepID=UPI001EDD1B54|nr:hypothetical protein [Sporosarcina cyprini]MCG3088738.1 hypothetical protein [Sporosarcina cyprini]
MKNSEQYRFNAKKIAFSMFICLFILSGCHNLQGSNSEMRSAYADNFEISGTTKEEIIGTVHPAIFTTVDRSNKEAIRKYGPVSSKNGIKLKTGAGRYELSGFPTGTISIFDQDNNLLLHEIVGDKAGSPTVTADIDSTFSILFDGGYNAITLQPVKTTLSTELTTGIWDVGLDIEPGDYTISIPEGHGFVHIFEQGEDPRLYELFGGGLTNTASTVQLKKGQKVRVSKTSTVYFEPVKQESADR